LSILVDKSTRLVVQGITGGEGSYHTKQCIAYGTNVVAGVTPGRGGQLFDGGIPVFDSMDQAVKETGANVSFVVVPAAFAADAIIEAAASGVSLIACITEKVPVMDMVRALPYLSSRGVSLMGPNCPGIISPAARCKIGIMPGRFYTPGRVGVVSRSGTLTYEAVSQLSGLGIGQSTCVGIGGDPVSGTSFIDILERFEDDPDTDNVVLIGEIGGTREQEAAEYIKGHFSKPVAALIVGRSAPPGRRMGHAGAIITGQAARAEEKIKALASAGAAIVPSPAMIGETIREVMGAVKA
jgi:succinyl-CoA synthetase alpha subunit